MTTAALTTIEPRVKLQQYTGSLSDGAWLGVPMDIYQSHPALSSSRARILLESPLTYQRTQDGELEHVVTDAMEYGTAMHAALFEQRFDFHVQPETYGPDKKKWNGNATECKQWLADHQDKIVLSASEARNLGVAVGYVRSHPKARKYLSGGHCEVTVIADGMKARPDYLIVRPDNTCIVVDLKTTTDARDRKFSSECLNRGYHIQLAWYRIVLKALGLTVTQCVILALQKGKLPLLNVLEMPEVELQLGELRCDEAKLLLSQCEANGYWPDFSGEDGVRPIKLPAYAFPEDELDLEN